MAVAEDSVGGLVVSRETVAALRALEALVRRWNPAINLVSKTTLPELWSRHIVDSAQLFAYRPESARTWGLRRGRPPATAR
ncbi:MAG: RsmG family class I SAM-dependent methyltransferase, partial [Tabrizicola sp.]